MEVNEAAVAHYGYTRTEFLRMAGPDLLLPDEMLRLLRRLHPTDPAWRLGGEWRHRCRHGRLIEVEVYAYALTFRGRAALVMTAQDITMRKQAERELETHTAEMRSINADLQHFAYIVAHDLHEPLRTITGFLDLLVQRYQGRLDAHADELIHFALDVTRRMQQMLQGL